MLGKPSLVNWSPHTCYVIKKREKTNLSWGDGSGHEVLTLQAWGFAFIKARTHMKPFLVCCPVFLQGNGKETGESLEVHGPSSLANVTANETLSQTREKTWTDTGDCPQPLVCSGMCPPVFTGTHTQTTFTDIFFLFFLKGHIWFCVFLYKWKGGF